ncbi:MAG: PDR/VanB family oxidoreductase [Burkholderiaceae bacterium]|jgi:ferredoxin-NADP reductase|nr:PDR/VanB family oxidoreductase [Burkholderiaceae bacterium]
MTTLTALVHTLRYEADGIISIELRPATAAVDFPAFEAGAHIDLHLPDGLVRSYSLCNPQTDRQRYVVGVLKDRKSRGGSRYLHEQLRVGTTLPISAPRNHFRLDESAPRSVLVAGGIGVTPVWCMAQRLTALKRPVELVYCARSRKETAFREPIEALGQTGALALAWHFDDERGGPPDLGALLAGRGKDSHYYCCGPAPMLDAFETACQRLNLPHVHIERFAAAPAPMQAMPQESFIVECARSGKTIEVPPGKSILDSLLDAGLQPEHSCQDGVCGACETRILSGQAEHRDSILTAQEQAANKTMMICVSGCKRGPLVLDI